jgi:short-subunit dehydrogenase
MKTDFDGAGIWLTGASSGIGAALAVELAARGARVAATARRADRLAELANDRITALAADVTDAAAMEAAAERAAEIVGRIDVSISCAGNWQQMDVDHFDPQIIRDHLDVHVMGLAHQLAAVLPDMLARGSGTIVGVSSVAGYRGLPRAEAYAAAKAAQQLLLESLRTDVSARGVQVTTVNPGFVETEMTQTNRFPMPWMVDAPTAARTIADGIAAGKAEVVFPTPMMLTMKAARLVPVGLWGKYAGRAVGARH